MPFGIASATYETWSSSKTCLSGERLGAGKRTRFDPFFAGRAETDQRTHIGAELHRFVFAQVARCSVSM